MLGAALSFRNAEAGGAIAELLLPEAPGLSAEAGE